MIRVMPGLSRTDCRTADASRGDPWLSQCNMHQIAIGLLGLAAGFLYYAMFRWQSPALVQTLVGNRLYLGWTVPEMLRSSVQSVPTALHVFSFSLLTIGVAGLPQLRYRFAFVALWVGINLAFECLQAVHPAAFVQIMEELPWKFEALQRFVVGGVFDGEDIMAAVAGGTLALIVSSITAEKEETDVPAE